MDAAQGANVSTPAPVSARGPVADAGEGILVSGGGGSPFRTAGGSGAAAPVQTTVQRGGGGRTQATQTQCPGGRCPTPSRVMSAPSNYQMFDDGGFPVTSSTVVSGPVVSSSAPVEWSGGSVSVPMAGDPASLRSQAQQSYSLGRVGESRFFERTAEAAAGESLAQQALSETRRLNTDAMERRAEAAKLARDRFDAENAQASADIATQRVNTLGAFERTAEGALEKSQAAKKEFLVNGSTPMDLADYLERLDSYHGLALDASGNADLSDQPISNPQIRERAESEAFGIFAVHGFVTSARIHREANQLGEDFDSALVPRADGETDEDYVQRRAEEVDRMYGRPLARVTDQIITGLQQTEAWKTRDLATLQKYMDSNIYAPLEKSLIASFVKGRPDVDPTITEFLAKDAAQDYYDQIKQAAGVALSDPNYNDKAPFSVNKPEMMSRLLNPDGEGSFWGGDSAPPMPAPADSNDTLPAWRQPKQWESYR
jgi:hypothetical protein